MEFTGTSNNVLSAFFCHTLKTQKDSCKFQTSPAWWYDSVLQTTAVPTYFPALAFSVVHNRPFQTIVWGIFQTFWSRLVKKKKTGNYSIITFHGLPALTPRVKRNRTIHWDFDKRRLHKFWDLTLVSDGATKFDCNSYNNRTCTIGSDLARRFRPSTSFGNSAGFFGSTATLTTGETLNFIT